MGLYTGGAGFDGSETDVMGLGVVLCAGYGAGPAGAESAARRLLEAVDQGDGAAAARCADELANVLSGGGEDDWHKQHCAKIRAAGGILGYTDLRSRDKLAFLKTVMPDRADDLGRAAAIIGVGDYEFPEAAPCAYLTAAGAQCRNTTQSPDRWCGSCARRPAVSVATLPLIEVPPAPASPYALHDNLPPADWEALLRRELSASVAEDLHDRGGYPPDATPFPTGTLNVILDKGQIIVVFPHRSLAGTDVALTGADRAVVGELLREHVDPELLMSGKVGTRCDVPASAMWDWDRTGRRKIRTRRTRDDLSRATADAAPPLGYAVRATTDAILAEHGPVRDLVVARRYNEPIWGGDLDVGWTDGPRSLRPHGASGPCAVQYVRTISSDAVGMVALKQHLGAFGSAPPDEAPSARARYTSYPDRWDKETAVAHPEIDPAWAAKVATHLGALHSGGTDLVAFMKDGGLTALEAVFGPPTATSA